MPPDPPTEAATRLLPPLAAWLLEPPPIQNPGYATDHSLLWIAVGRIKLLIM